MKSFLLLLLTCLTAFADPRRHFDPRQNSAVVNWWDGSFNAAGTITLANMVHGGQSMTASSSQPTLIPYAQNGWQEIHFTNSEFVTTASETIISSNFHVFVVARSSNTNNPVFVGDTAVNNQTVALSGGQFICYNNGQQKTSTSYVSVAGFTTLEVSCLSGVCSFYTNGVSAGATGTGVITSSMQYKTLGNIIGSAFLAGDILAVIQCNAQQTGNAQAQIENYLRYYRFHHY